MPIRSPLKGGVQYELAVSDALQLPEPCGQLTCELARLALCREVRSRQAVGEGPAEPYPSAQRCLSIHDCS